MSSSIFLFGIIILCLSLFLLFLLAIKKATNLAYGNSIQTSDVSLAIPFRDEPLISNQFEQIKNQLAGTNTPVYWIDDNSSLKLPDFEKQISQEPNFHLLRNRNFGKKSAIIQVLKEASTEWVLLLDADTIPNLESIIEGKLKVADHHNMILFPIAPIKEKSFLRRLFDIEFLVLQLATHTSVFLGRPLLANGAALMVRRTAYLDSLDLRDDFHLKSGDDVFAMFAMAKKFGNHSIGSAFVSCLPFKVKFPVRPSSVFSQRSRWISKTPAVKDNWFRFVSVLVLLGNLSLIGLLILAFIASRPSLCIGIVCIYLFSASLFASTAIRDFKRPDLFPYAIPAILVFPFYLVAIILVTLLKKPNWK